MRCDELYQLLTIYNRQSDRTLACQFIATHIRACLSCASGLTRLAQSLLSLDSMTCELCRARFPSYYEATHPNHPQVSMPDMAIAEVALHLGRCAACHQQYEALVELSEMEEMGQ